jgi:serine/threonine protein phosphatase PrpC
MILSIYGETNVGRQRDHNEDSFLILAFADNKWDEVNKTQFSLKNSQGLIFVVADGMGGANAGEIASSIAVDTVRQSLKAAVVLPNESQVQDFLSALVLQAQDNIVKKARRHKEMKGMGTTMVAGLITVDALYVVWSGDSRCYIYNQQNHRDLFPFTDDHSLVWSRVKSGEITPEEARLSDNSNLILNALGDTYQRPVPEFKSTRLNTGDKILACSDGLNSMLSDVGIQQIINFNGLADKTCTALIAAANNAGGRDNITVILIDIIESDEKEKPADVTRQEINFEPETKKKRHKIRWIGIILLLLLILLCIASIAFRQEIGSIIKKQGLFSNLFLHEKDTLLSDKKNNSQPDEVGPLNKPPDESSAVKGMEKSANKTIKRIADPNAYKELKNSMDSLFQRINKMINEIEDYNPEKGKTEYQHFYNQNKTRLDSLNFKLNKLKRKITGVAKIEGGKMIYLTDTLGAADLFPKIKFSVDSLYSVKESIILSRQPEK